MCATPNSENGFPRLSALAKSLSRSNGELDPEKLGRYLREIVAWNDQVGLVSKQATASVLERLVLQSAQLYQFICDHEVMDGVARPHIVDVGSGGGFPGLVWRIIRPEMDLLLVERKAKKAAFLHRTCLVLGFDDVEVVDKDSSEVMALEKYECKFDLAVAMAVGPPSELAPKVEGFLRPGGYFCTVRPRDDADHPGKVGKQLLPKAAEEKNQSLFYLYQREE
jgi:16S rRNA (guanine527-N7)-methyltransferase